MHVKENSEEFAIIFTHFFFCHYFYSFLLYEFFTD